MRPVQPLRAAVAELVGRGHNATVEGTREGHRRLENMAEMTGLP